MVVVKTLPLAWHRFNISATINTLVCVEWYALVSALNLIKQFNLCVVHEMINVQMTPDGWGDVN